VKSTIRFGIMAALFASAPVSATCLISGSNSGVTQLSYDPFAAVPGIADVEVTLRNDGDETCSAHVYLRPSGNVGTLSSGSDQLSYLLDGNLVAGAPQPGEEGPFAISLAAGAEQTLTIRANVAGQQIVPPGTYSDTLQLRAETDVGDPVVLAGSSVLLEANVLARAEMSVSGTAAPPFSAADLAPAGIDFGTAVTGASRRVFVNVWANSSVTVEISSANGGMLRHMENAALPAIAYSATFDGDPAVLTGLVQAQRSPPATLSGASYEFAVTLGDVSGKFAGSYQDIVTINVASN
jgi:spore coat protein U-like protein